MSVGELHWHETLPRPEALRLVAQWRALAEEGGVKTCSHRGCRRLCLVQVWANALAAWLPAGLELTYSEERLEWMYRQCIRGALRAYRGGGRAPGEGA